MTVISLSLTLASNDCYLHAVILGTVDWHVLMCCVCVCVCVCVRVCVCVHKGMFVHFLFGEPKLASQFRKACSPCWQWYLSLQIPHFVPVVRIMNINVLPCYFSAQIMMMTKPKNVRQQKHTQTLTVKTQDWLTPCTERDVRSNTESDAEGQDQGNLRSWKYNRFVKREEKIILSLLFKLQFCTLPVQWKLCSPDTLILKALC